METAVQERAGSFDERIFTNIDDASHKLDEELSALYKEKEEVKVLLVMAGKKLPIAKDNRDRAVKFSRYQVMEKNEVENAKRSYRELVIYGKSLESRLSDIDRNILVLKGGEK